MMFRLPFFIVGLFAVSVPALAQTRVAGLSLGEDIGLVAFSPRGDKIAAGVGKDRVGVWSLPEGKLLQDLKFPQPPSALLFAPADHLIIALADGALEVRDVATGSAIRRMNAGVSQAVLAVSSDGRLLASSGREQIHLWGASGALLHTLGHEFGSVASLAFSPDGSHLASSGFDTNVHLWDVSTGEQRASLSDQRLATFAVTFTADGRNLIIGGANGAIEIVDMQTARIARRLRPERHPVGALSLSADGRSVATAYFDAEGMTRPAPLAIWDLASGRVVRRVRPAGAPAAAIGFISDGWLLYAMAKGHALSVWKLAAPSTSPSAPGSNAGGKPY